MVFIRSERSGRSRPPSKNVAKQPPLKNAAKYLPQWFLTTEGSTKSFQGTLDSSELKWKGQKVKRKCRRPNKKKKRSKVYNIMKTVKEHKNIKMLRWIKSNIINKKGPNLSKLR